METYLKYLPILSVAIIYALRMMEVSVKRNTVQGEITETFTFRLFMISGIITIAGGIFEYVWNDYAWHLLPFTLGLIFGIASFAIRWSTIKALGSFWSLHNELREEHQFIQIGLFKWMRHPTYFSMILELLAGMFILSAPISGIIAFMVFIPTLCYRIKSEELLLINKFGKEYVEYKKNTLAIFPKYPRAFRK